MCMYTISVASISDHINVVTAREEVSILSENSQIPLEYENLKKIFSKIRA